ncbi:unnamed protein product, partial [Porites lobata]
EFNNLYHPEFLQDIFIKYEYHYLNATKVGTFTVHNSLGCALKCLGNPFCLSVNLAASKGADGKYWCELLSSEKYSNPKMYEGNKSSHHLTIMSPCLSSPCQNGGICTADFKNHAKSTMIECQCKGGFSGKFCERGSWENLKCDSLVNRLKETRLVTLLLDSNLTTVLCHMGDFGCGDGGWTPVMKMDGNKRTFHYDSRYWTNKETVTPDGGKTGFDIQETKLPSYWNTSFSKICLGMRINNQSRFIVIKRTATSLHSLIADGKYRNTSLGRDTWKSLNGSEASMQFNCNREGFNAKSDKQYSQGRDQAKARIGILGNNENDCGQCDSRIGFGTGGVHDDSNTCGNEAKITPLDNGYKHIKAMGYILVQ